MRATGWRGSSASSERPDAVVVTGASSGIGCGCALKLANSGFRVSAGVRKEQDAEALRDAAAGDLIPLFINVTDPSLVASAVSTVEEAVGGGGIAGLVNNAGMGNA